MILELNLDLTIPVPILDHVVSAGIAIIHAEYLPSDNIAAEESSDASGSWLLGPPRTGVQIYAANVGERWDGRGWDSATLSFVESGMRYLYVYSFDCFIRCMQCALGTQRLVC